MQYYDSIFSSFKCSGIMAWATLDPERPSPKRHLPTFEKKPTPSPTFPHKTRKKRREMLGKKNLDSRGGEVHNFHSCIFILNSLKRPSFHCLLTDGIYALCMMIFDRA